MNEDEYKREHMRRIVEGCRRSGRKLGRPRKEINVPVVLQRLNQGISKMEIAAGQHCSVTTLNQRLVEAGIVKKGEWVQEEVMRDGAPPVG
jgi:DNA invertase Pin-like site-specific DNA recombinase